MMKNKCSATGRIVDFNLTTCPECGQEIRVTRGWGKIMQHKAPVTHCAVCGEREGSHYVKPCCTDDNMIEA